MLLCLPGQLHVDHAVGAARFFGSSSSSQLVQGRNLRDAERLRLVRLVTISFHIFLNFCLVPSLMSEARLYIKFHSSGRKKNRVLFYCSLCGQPKTEFLHFFCIPSPSFIFVPIVSVINRKIGEYWKNPLRKG